MMGGISGMDPSDLIRRIRDPRFYLENFCQIRSKTKGMVRFVLKPAQLHLFNEIKKHNRICLTKCRQLGFSSAMAGWVFHRAVTYPGTYAAIVSYDSDQARDTLEKMRVFLNGLPDEIRPTVQTDAKDELYFPRLASKIKVIAAKDVMGRGFTFNVCLAEGTIVYGWDGKPIRVDQLKDGTVIVNGQGGPSVVSKVSVRPLDENEEVREISGWQIDPITLTGEHLVLTRKRKNESPDPSMTWKIGKATAVWRKASEVNKDDYLAWPKWHTRDKHSFHDVPRVICKGYESRSNPVPDKVEINRALGRLFGWTIAEGSFGSNRATLSVDSDEVEEVKKVITDVFPGIPNLVSLFMFKDSRTVNVTINSKRIAEMLRIVGEGAENKSIPRIFWRYGNEFCFGLIEGMFRGDGCLNNPTISDYTTISPSLATQLRLLLLSTGIGMSSLNFVEEPMRYGVKNRSKYAVAVTGKANHKLRDKCNFPVMSYGSTGNLNGLGLSFKKKGSSKYKETSHWVFCRVRENKISGYSGNVYDVTLDGRTHSFLTQAGVVHNCHISELAFWDRQDDKMAALLAAVPPGESKIVIESCVTPDTFVTTSDGLRRIGWTHDFDNSGPGFSKGERIMVDGRFGMKPCEDYYDSGAQDGYFIRFASGRIIGTSSIHRMLVFTTDAKYKYVEARKLKKGDRVPLKIGQNVFGKEKALTAGQENVPLSEDGNVTEELAYALGMIMASGRVNPEGGIDLSKRKADILEFLSSHGLKTEVKELDTGVIAHRILEQPLLSWLRSLGVYSTSQAQSHNPIRKLGRWDYYGPDTRIDGEIPKEVFYWTRELFTAFLQGFLDIRCEMVRSKVASSSQMKGDLLLQNLPWKMAESLQVALANYGIHSTLRRESETSGKERDHRKCWYNVIINGYYSGILHEKIGFRDPEKAAWKSLLNSKKTRGSATIPYMYRFVQFYRKELGIGTRQTSLLRTSKKKNLRDLGMTYEMAESILFYSSKLKSAPYRELKEITANRYLYDEIVEIEQVSHPKVVDFSIPDGQSVAYSQLLGHQTPNLQYDYYHRLYSTPDNGWHKLKYGWHWEYTREELEQKRLEYNDPDRFAREFLCEFTGSGHSVFDYKMIEQAMSGVWKVGGTYQDMEGDWVPFMREENFTVYKPPKPGRTYVCGCDSSENKGEKGDYSVAVVFDRETGEEVAFYRGKIDPDKFGEVLFRIGSYFNTALLAPEINSSGISVIDTLRRLIYPNLYFRPASFDKITGGISERLGWKTTSLTRPKMIDKFREMFREGSILIHSEPILTEMMTFVYNMAGKAEAMSGSHDDTVMAASIGVMCFEVTAKDEDLGQIDWKQYMPIGGY